MIELKDIEVKYNEFVAVKDLNLTINKGEFFTLLGPSGCGKTTTLRTIAGFINPSKGEILFNGKDITHLKPEDRKVGVVFQNYALFPHMTVYDNIAFGLQVRREKRQTIAEKVKHYASIAGVEEQLNKRVTALSGGQQQRVAIARSIILEPEILLMDEPLSNLDAKLRLSMRNELKRLQRTLGITTVYVTHDQEEALTISDRIAVFNAGVVEQIGGPSEIYLSPSSENVCCFIGDTNRLSASFLAQAGVLDQLNLSPEEVRAYIRLERILLLQDKEQIPNGMVGVPTKVKEVIYSGMNLNYSLECCDQILKVVALDNGSYNYKVDQEVFFTFDPQDEMVFGAEP